MENEFNNFHCWFPGGAYRANWQFPEGKDPRIIENLDAVLEETGFDIDRYQTLDERFRVLDNEVTTILFKKARKENREPTQDEQRRLQEIEEEWNPLVEQIHDTIRPVYERMLERGYTRGDLCG